VIYETYKNFITSEITEMFDSYLKLIEEEQDEKTKGRYISFRKAQSRAQIGESAHGILFRTR
jgi:hypothetical protein